MVATIRKEEGLKETVSTKMKGFFLNGMVSTKQNGFRLKEWFPIKRMAFTKRNALQQKNGFH